MRKLGIWLLCVGTVWCSSFGCDQELLLPDRPGAEEADAGAPSSGITGAGGAGDEPLAPSRLPLPDGPLHGPLGGGGEAGQGAEGGEPGHSVPLGPAAGGSLTGSGGKGQTPPGGAASSGADGTGGEAEWPAAGRRVLFFSEYLEGTGSLKALEIHSVNASSLEGCELATYYNGKSEPAHLALHGSLPPGGVQVLCSSGLATAQPDVCDRSTNLTFNGDDAIALVCGNTTFDVFGQVGLDPGDAWGGATMDHTLRRRCEVTAGRSDGSTAFDPTTEWAVLGPDQFDDLGRHDCPDLPGAGGASVTP